MSGEPTSMEEAREKGGRRGSVGQENWLEQMKLQEGKCFRDVSKK